MNELVEKTDEEEAATSKPLPQSRKEVGHSGRLTPVATGSIITKLKGICESGKAKSYEECSSKSKARRAGMCVCSTTDMCTENRQITGRWAVPQETTDLQIVRPLLCLARSHFAACYTHPCPVYGFSHFSFA